MSDDIGCTIKELPYSELVPAAQTAIKINPANGLNLVTGTITALVADGVIEPEHLAMLVSKYWGGGGVHLTVGFMESTPQDLQARIVAHANAWSEHCNVRFVLSNTDPQVRISRGSGGYWSYLGTDILHIPKSQQTMNLEGFTMQTPESEFRRVVRHEFGHTLSFPHEHMRQELIRRLDPQKTIAYFLRTQGWSAQVTTQQVLTPLSENSLRGTAHADQDSIMCYQLPGSITIDGQPIHGGNDIDELDAQFAASLYPKEVVNPPPPVKPPTNGGVTVMIGKILSLLAAFRAKDYIGAFKILVDILSSIQAGSITDAEMDEVQRTFSQAATK